MTRRNKLSPEGRRRQSNKSFPIISDTRMRDTNLHLANRLVGFIRPPTRATRHHDSHGHRRGSNRETSPCHYDSPQPQHKFYGRTPKRREPSWVKENPIYTYTTEDNSALPDQTSSTRYTHESVSAIMTQKEDPIRSPKVTKSQECSRNIEQQLNDG